MAFIVTTSVWSLPWRECLIKCTIMHIGIIKGTNIVADVLGFAGLANCAKTLIKRCNVCLHFVQPPP